MMQRVKPRSTSVPRLGTRVSGLNPSAFTPVSQQHVHESKLQGSRFQRVALLDPSLVPGAEVMHLLTPQDTPLFVLTRNNLKHCDSGTSLCSRDSVDDVVSDNRRRKCRRTDSAASSQPSTSYSYCSGAATSSGYCSSDYLATAESEIDQLLSNADGSYNMSTYNRHLEDSALDSDSYRCTDHGSQVNGLQLPERIEGRGSFRHSRISRRDQRSTLPRNQITQSASCMFNGNVSHVPQSVENVDQEDTLYATIEDVMSERELAVAKRMCRPPALPPREHRAVSINHQHDVLTKDPRRLAYGRRDGYTDDEQQFCRDSRVRHSAPKDLRSRRSKSATQSRRVPKECVRTDVLCFRQNEEKVAPQHGRVLYNQQTVPQLNQSTLNRVECDRYSSGDGRIQDVNCSLPDSGFNSFENTFRPQQPKRFDESRSVSESHWDTSRPSNAVTVTAPGCPQKQYSVTDVLSSLERMGLDDSEEDESNPVFSQTVEHNALVQFLEENTGVLC